MTGTTGQLHDVTESLCRRCGRWLLLGALPTPLVEQMCTPCRVALQHQESER